MKTLLLWPFKRLFKLFILLNAIVLAGLACFWAAMNFIGISCGFLDVVASVYAALLAGIFLLFCT